jgi:hypothetical protein
MMPPLNFMSMYFGCRFAVYEILFYKTNKSAAWIMHKDYAKFMYANLAQA